LKLFLKKDDQYSVQCQTQQAPNCEKNGDYCDSEEEARDWVEEDCWIDSGEGWICNSCHEYFMANLVQNRRDLAQVSKNNQEEDKKLPPIKVFGHKKKEDGLDNELADGIDVP